MAWRVTAAEVKEIIDTDLTATQVESFIPGANLIVTNMCGYAYDADVLKELERWLAAHLVSIRDPTKSAFISQKADTVEQKYQLTAASPVGLATTRYGQQVLILDYLGKMADLGKTSTRAEWASVGAPNAEFD